MSFTPVREILRSRLPKVLTELTLQFWADEVAESYLIDQILTGINTCNFQLRSQTLSEFTFEETVCLRDLLNRWFFRMSGRDCLLIQRQGVELINQLRRWKSRWQVECPQVPELQKVPHFIGYVKERDPSLRLRVNRFWLKYEKNLWKRVLFLER